MLKNPHGSFTETPRPPREPHGPHGTDGRANGRTDDGTSLRWAWELGAQVWVKVGLGVDVRKGIGVRVGDVGGGGDGGGGGDIRRS